MTHVEQLELQAHHAQLNADVLALVDKYLAIAEWDVPDIREPLGIQLIVDAIRRALDGVEQALPPLGRG